MWDEAVTESPGNRAYAGDPQCARLKSGDLQSRRCSVAADQRGDDESYAKTNTACRHQQWRPCIAICSSAVQNAAEAKAQDEPANYGHRAP